MQVRRRQAGVALGALVLLLVWACAHGPAAFWGLSLDAGADPRPGGGPAPSTSAPTGSAPPDSQIRSFQQPSWLHAVTAVALLALALVVAVAVWRWAASRTLPSWPEAPERATGPVPVLDEETAEAQRTVLREGTPRNAIVACWVELEQLVTRAGVAQDPAETSTELARRVLRELEVPDEPVTALAGAYREARFSRHPVTEDDRAAAARALEEIHRALLARSAR